MRLMSPDEVIEDEAILREGAEMFGPSPDARYVFTDDGSNWAGVYVQGPLTGRLTILNHDGPSVAPRFRSLDSFLDSLVQAGRDDLDWTDMRTDYPLTPDSDAALVAEAEPLCDEYLARYHAARDDGRDREVVDAVRTALNLLPPARWPVLRDLLASPRPLVRFTALVVAVRHRRPELVPHLIDCARAAREQGNYTLWSMAVDAVRAAGAKTEAAALRRAAPSSWR
jgi:hypothetical protein